jgi:hypothetical protein
MSSVRERFLQQAGEARALAEAANPVLRDDFLRIAESWELLANSLEDAPGTREASAAPAHRG